MVEDSIKKLKYSIVSGLILAAVAVWVNYSLGSGFDSPTLSVQTEKATNQDQEALMSEALKYPPGTLVKNYKGDIYLVRQDGLHYISSPDYLNQHIGQPIITVDSKILDYLSRT